MNRILLFFMVLLGIGAIDVGAWIMLDEKRRIVEIQIPAEVLETVDTSRYSIYPVMLQRFSEKDCVLVTFPPGLSSNVSLQLYDSARFERLKSGNRNVAPLSYPLRLGKWMQKPIINLSGQPDGSYYTRLSYCNFGGFIQIQLLTQKDSIK